MRVRRAVAAVMTVVLVAGCSQEPDAKEAEANLDENRLAVTKEVKDAARVLAAGDWERTRLGGGFLTCGSRGLGPATIKYSAGGSLTGGQGTQVERIRAASGMLEDAGWKLVDAGHSNVGGEYSRLTRNGLELSIDKSQLRGSQDFGFGVSGECIKVTDEQVSDPPGDDQIVL